MLAGVTRRVRANSTREASAVPDPIFDVFTYEVNGKNRSSKNENFRKGNESKLAGP
jgi:hypothetical protein